MSFIRIKEIGPKNGKKYKYAYLVENKWRKRLKGGKKGSRQKVSKYLGKVISEVDNRESNNLDERDFFGFVKQGKEEYMKNKKEKVISDLTRYELHLRGFVDNNGIMIKDNLNFNLAKRRFINQEGEEENIVLEINEGFLCKFTLDKLVNFRVKGDDEREIGISLAKAFLEAGLKVSQEVFIGYFEKI
jgi:hypothetical protein